MAILRRATVGDIDVLLPLIQAFYEIDGHEYREAHIVRALTPLLRDDTLGQVWLIVDGPDGPDGYAILTWGWSLESGGRDALLDEIYVRDRGHGVGSRALEELVDAARAAGASRVFLETEAHNDAVRRFYGRHRFVDERSVWMLREL